MAMIKEKLKGHKPIIAAAPERGNVVNLMDALKASLGQAKPPATSRSKAKAAPAEEAAAEGRRLRRPPPRPGQEQGVTAADGAVFGIVGALAAFPRRLAARAVEARGGTLRRGVGRAHHPRRPRPPPARPHARGGDRGPRRRRARRRPHRSSARPASCGCSASPSRRRPAASPGGALDRLGADRDRARPARALRRLRARRRALVVPRPDPRPQVRDAAPRRRQLVGDRPLGAPLRPGRRADRRDAARSAPAAACCSARRRGARARRPAPPRPRRARATTPRSSSPPPRPPRPRAGRARPPTSTAAAWRSTPATRSPPSTAPTACGRSASPTRRRTTTCAPPRLDRGFVEAWFNLGCLAAERGAAAAARRHLDPGAGARPRLRRRGLQPRRARVRRRPPRRGPRAAGSATSSSTPTATGAAAPPRASPTSTWRRAGGRTG